MNILEVFMYRLSQCVCTCFRHNSEHSHIDHTLGLLLCLFLCSLILGEFFSKKNSYIISELGEILYTQPFETIVDLAPRSKSKESTKIGCVQSQIRPRHYVWNIDLVKISYKFAYVGLKSIVRQFFFAHQHLKAPICEIGMIISDLYI